MNHSIFIFHFFDSTLIFLAFSLINFWHDICCYSLVVANIPITLSVASWTELIIYIEWDRDGCYRKGEKKNIKQKGNARYGLHKFI